MRLGMIDIACGLTGRGLRLFGTAQRVIDETGAVLEFVDATGPERALAAARTQVSPEEFEQMWQEGRAMSMEQAIDYALSEE